MLPQAHRIPVSVLPWRRLFSGHIERLGPDPRQNL
jgi:hypothetical protein